MRDFLGKWGWTHKQIITMPREDFCFIHGDRFMNMNYSTFRRTIRRETPFVNNLKRNLEFESHRWNADRCVNKVEYLGLRLGAWDEVSSYI